MDCCSSICSLVENLRLDSMPGMLMTGETDDGEPWAAFVAVGEEAKAVREWIEEDRGDATNVQFSADPMLLTEGHPDYEPTNLERNENDE